MNNERSEGIARVFLGWDRPWAVLFAEWLGRDSDRLTRRCVVVPTRESGRRLRECLVGRAVREGTGAVLGPRVVTPNDFFRPDIPMPDAVRWAGWVQVLRDADDAAVSALFPAGLSGKDDGWRLGVAREIEQARELLTAGNADFAAVAAAIPEDGRRWSQLAEIERRVGAVWNVWGHADPVQAKRDRARNPVLPVGVEEVVLAGVADPTGLSVEAWRRLAARGVRFTVLIGAPAELKENFDEWGRPQPAAWADRERYTTPEPTSATVAEDAVGLAQAVIQACAGKPNDEIAVGVCDASFAPALSHHFLEAGWRTFDPQGVALPRDGWPGLLEDLAAAVESPNDHASIARVAHHPEIWRRLLRGSGAKTALAALDTWEAEHAATDAGMVIAELCGSERKDRQAAGALLRAVKDMATLRPGTGSGSLAATLSRWLSEAGADVAPRALAEIDAWEGLSEAGFGLPLRLRWLAASLGSVAVSPDVPGAALGLQGWLELPYEPAPHLVLAALHEGSVPEAPPGNPLITEVVREKLALRDRRSRLAREVFLYTAMVEGRRAQGSVTVVTAQMDPRGEPCQPSRVLLQAAPAILPSRVLRFVKGQKPDVPRRATPRWSREGWRLHRPAGAPRNKDWTEYHLSPSALRRYLACPTRFYFSDVLGWEEVRPFDGELDPGGFGDLLHAVLRQWGEDPQARGLAGVPALTTCWLGLLDREVAARFGKKPPPLIRLQAMSARERLVALAEHQAAQRQGGWHVTAVEQSLEGVLRLAGVPVHLRIDRIDRHDDGRARVIDYKTGAKGDGPAKAHLRVWSQEKCPAALGPLVPGVGKTKNKECCWADLQLPLYVAAARKAMDLETAPEAWYVVMPPSVGDTGFEPFAGLGERLDNALEWAEEAARRIVIGHFWPPAPRVEHDLFGTLAPEGLQAAFDGEWAAFLSSSAEQREGRIS